jgi:predicted DNA-binding protein
MKVQKLELKIETKFDFQAAYDAVEKIESGVKQLKAAIKKKIKKPRQAIAAP